ncbi:MAG: hypothetical protein OEQ74_06535, partial [Gammaproteobacteria bacterium]|nr:hypothetical protein [Gammaproteobacteria bacterium]
MWPVPVSTEKAAVAILRTPAVSNAWQIGTILEAVALSDSVKGRVQLQIGARVVSAQTSLPLEAGQTLRLQVAETGRTVVLQTVGDAPEADPVRAGIRQSLPRQLPQTRVLAAAVDLSRPELKLPPDLKIAVERLVNVIRSATSLTQGPGLKTAVQDSGVLLESRLAEMVRTPNARVSLTQDWKAALLRFRDQLAHLQVKLAASTPRQARPPALSAPVSLSGSPPSVSAAVAAVNTALADAKLPAAPATASPAAASEKPVAPANQPVVSPISGAAKSAQQVPPPMRHALPHPQPVTQSTALPGEPTSLVGELIRESDGALARVRLNQLGSV